LGSYFNPTGTPPASGWAHTTVAELLEDLVVEMVWPIIGAYPETQIRDAFENVQVRFSGSGTCRRWHTPSGRKTKKEIVVKLNELQPENLILLGNDAQRLFSAS
jgi:hypothetical protein